jgi:hypothetical protein
VQVHGAWADDSCWEKVTPILQARGASVVSVQLHLTSLTEDAAIVRRELERRSGKVLYEQMAVARLTLASSSTKPGAPSAARLASPPVRGWRSATASSRSISCTWAMPR